MTMSVLIKITANFTGYFTSKIQMTMKNEANSVTQSLYYRYEGYDKILKR